MKLVTTAQMRAIEKEADSKGVSYAQMMQNAGRGLAEIVHAVGQANGWDEVNRLIAGTNPHLLATMGILVTAALIWLMRFKPF
ncbi:MAG: hypothetical protein QY328_10320 [Anaerolineales bacterium]|nr:MAG: hypothetical protein QY328_10320 [Anaerolineales bacterium]